MKQKSEKTTHDIHQIFDWIVEYKTVHDGNSPTMRELAAACKISSLSVTHYALGRLERAGKIRMAATPPHRRRIVVIGGEWHFTNPTISSF